jgi:hypothetical protein
VVLCDPLKGLTQPLRLRFPQTVQVSCLLGDRTSDPRQEESRLELDSSEQQPRPPLAGRSSQGSSFASMRVPEAYPGT